MGFSSTDDFVNEVTVNGKFWRTDYLKNLTPLPTTVAVGKWYDLNGFPGNPIQFMHGNMVLNGDFMATMAPWTTTLTWSYSAANHNMSHGTANDGAVLSQTVKCVPGEKYTLIWTKGAGAGAIMPSLGGTNGTSRTTASTLYREEIIMGTTNALLSFTTTDATASVVDLVWLFKAADFMPYTSETECAMYIGPTPAVGETKHLINMSAFNNALLGSPSILELVDIIGVYPGCKTNTTNKQTLTHSTRLRNGNFQSGDATGWTCGAHWAYAASLKIARTQFADTETLSQGPLDILAGVPYQLRYTMSGSAGVGTITASLGGATGTPHTADGTYTETLTPTTTAGTLTFTPTSNNIATNISDVTLVPMFPRYTTGAGLRFFHVTSFDTLPTTGGQNVQSEYRNTTGWPTYTAVDSCDVTTNWTDSANMTVSVNTTNFKSGVGALNLTKDSVTTALTYTSKTTTSVDFTGKKLCFWFYINPAGGTAYGKLAAAAALTVRFGSDSSNYYRWDFANTALLGQGLLAASTGWQYIECSMLSYTSRVGTPVLASCAYTYIGLTASDGTTITWSAGDFVIDQIEVVAEGSQLGATVANVISSGAGWVIHSGVAANNIGPFLPLAAGDSGVSKIENLIFSGASAAAGSICVVVCKPIASIPLPYGFVAAERDFMSQLPSLPRIYDGACLGFLLYDGAVSVAGTQWAGHLDFAWG